MLTTLPIAQFITYAFLLGYWVGIFILLYHLIRFGVGAHPKIIALVLTIGSLGLTICAIIILNQIQ